MIGRLYLNPRRMTITEVTDEEIREHSITNVYDRNGRDISGDPDQLANADYIEAGVENRWLLIPSHMLETVQ